MNRPFTVDADSHVLEPPDLWENYLEPRYRDRAIRIDEPGKTSIFKNSTLIFKIELLSLGADCGVADTVKVG